MTKTVIRGSMEQLDEWVKGNSIHYKSGCVPDLSCCVLGIETPLHERKRFVEAVKNDEATIVKEMLQTFFIRFKDKYGDFLKTEVYHA